MMKKCLVALLLLALCASFFACGGEHTHTAVEAWSHSDMYHWHACTKKSCTVVLNQVPHTWNDGEVTKEPSPTADGIRTYTCTICGHQGTEAIPYEADAS